MSDKNEVENMRFRKSDDLCKMAETLGYNGGIQQLQCNNGAYVSSLLNFFDDNPGAMEAVRDWALENLGLDDEIEEELEDEEEIEDEDLLSNNE